MSVARRVGAAALILGAFLGCTTRLRAQDSTGAARVDTTQHDTTQRDTTPPAPPKAPSPLASLAPAPEVPAGPLPAGTRYVFTRDSLLWSGGYTLADLLARIPGAYVARAGFLELPEPVIYGARGQDGIHIYWDGVEMIPLGPDSLAIDPGRISLVPLDRVEVVQSPGALDVYLVSARNDTPQARTDVRIMSGVGKTGGYSGVFAIRGDNGLELAASADYLGTNGYFGTATGDRSDRTFDLWVKGDWVASPRTSASYQLRHHGYRRDPLNPGGDGTLLGVDGARTDAILSFDASTRPAQLGWGARFTFVTSKWSDTLGFNQSARQASLRLGYRSPALTANVTGRLGDDYEKSVGEAHLAWEPIRGIVLSGDSRAARLTGDRTTWRVHGALSMGVGPLELLGQAARRRAIAAPWLLADTAQLTTDVEGRFRFSTRVLSADIGLARYGAYTPVPLESYPSIASLGTTPQTTYAIAAGSFTPIRPLTFSGWYASPTKGDGAAFQPRRLLRGAVTFRTKFWPTFRSGAFDLEARLSLESWGNGVAGVDSSGAPVALPAARIAEFFLQFEIVRFRAFYDLRNAFNTQRAYVPGYDYPRVMQTFGVRWTFFN